MSGNSSSISEDNVLDSSIEIIEPNISTITVNSSPLSSSSNDESDVICHCGSTKCQPKIWKNAQKQQINISDLPTAECDSDCCEITSANTSTFSANSSSTSTSSYDDSIGISHCGCRICRTTNWRNLQKQQTNIVELPNAGRDSDCYEITPTNIESDVIILD